LPWQRHVVDTALEHDDDTGDLIYRQVVMTVPRQSGKTTLVLAKSAHRLVVSRRKLGRQTLTYTAQNRQAAVKKLEREFASMLRDSRSFKEMQNVKARPVKPTEWMLRMNSGAEHILFGGGSIWQVDTPSRTGSHGDVLDEGFIDEAFAHYDSDVEDAMGPAMITRRNAQIWVLSTAGDEKSVYLWRKILEGRAACVSGEHDGTAYFEWSADDDADPSDPQVWASCSPALGHTITLKALADEWAKAKRGGVDGTNGFRRAFLNQWPKIPVLLEEKSEFATLWAGRLIEGAAAGDPVMFGLGVSLDGEFAAIGVAGPGVDGVDVVECAYSKPGTAWVVAQAVETLGRHPGSKLVVDVYGPAGELVGPLEAAGVSVHKASTREAVQACGSFLTAVREGQVVHPGQIELDAAVAGARRRDVGDAWMWGRRTSTADVSPLEAVTLARWALSSLSPKTKSAEPFFMFSK